MKEWLERTRQKKDPREQTSIRYQNIYIYSEKEDAAAGSPCALAKAI